MDVEARTVGNLAKNVSEIMYANAAANFPARTETCVTRLLTPGVFLVTRTVYPTGRTTRRRLSQSHAENTMTFFEYARSTANFFDNVEPWEP